MKPTPSAFERDVGDTVFSPAFAGRSITRIATPPRMQAKATTIGPPSIASIMLMRRKPRITDGRKPTRMLRTKRHDTGLPEQPVDHRPESAPVEHDHGQDRAQLDDDVEHLPLVRIEAEQLGGEDQVAGRGDREEFRDALDDAENDRDQEDGHEGIGSGFRRTAVK